MIKTWNDYIKERNKMNNDYEDPNYENICCNMPKPLNVIDPYYQSKIVEKIFQVIGEISFRCPCRGVNISKIVIKNPKTSCKSITYKHDNMHGWRFSAKFKTKDGKTCTVCDHVGSVFDEFYDVINFSINDAFTLLNEVYEMYKPVDLDSEIRGLQK